MHSGAETRKEHDLFSGLAMKWPNQSLRHAVMLIRPRALGAVGWTRAEARSRLEVQSSFWG